MARRSRELVLADRNDGVFVTRTPEGPRLETPRVEPVSVVSKIDWLWENRIPLRKVTLIQGPGASGKSFVALDVAARVSAGYAWPDGPSEEREPQEVLLLCRQDDSFDTVAARLERAGGHPERLFEFEGFMRCNPGDNPEDEVNVDRDVRFPFDLPALDHRLEQQPDLRLVVIDPLSEYCRGAGALAATIRRLNAIASERDVAIVVTLRGDCQFESDGRLRLKSAWPTDGVRAVWGVAEDPGDHSRRMFLPVRFNACELPGGLAFRVSENRVVWETPEPGEPAAIVEEVREVDTWLLALLAEGELAASVIFRQGAACGYSQKMLREARKRRKVGLRRIGYGPKGCWGWAIGEIASRVDGPAIGTTGPAGQ